MTTRTSKKKAHTQPLKDSLVKGMSDKLFQFFSQNFFQKWEKNEVENSDFDDTGDDDGGVDNKNKNNNDVRKKNQSVVFFNVNDKSSNLTILFSSLSSPLQSFRQSSSASWCSSSVLASLSASPTISPLQTSPLFSPPIHHGNNQHHHNKLLHRCCQGVKKNLLVLFSFLFF